MTTPTLVGTWKLESWQSKATDGEITFPYGRDALGYIVYTAGGFMSVSIMRANRSNFSSGDLLGGSDPEKLAAIESYLSYCGMYEFDGVQVTHHVQMSLFPNWVGMEQIRLVEFIQDGFRLSTHPMLLKSKMQVATLEWRRP